MGYQNNPVVYVFDQFEPDPLLPLQVVVPAATEIYASWLFGGIVNVNPPTLATPMLGNTVLRIDAGENGANVGRIKGRVAVNFENLSSPASFTVLATAGFDLNTINEVEVFRIADTDPRLSNSNPFGRFNLDFFTILPFSSIVAAGKTYIDLGVKVFHGGVGNKTIEVGLSSSYYWQIERLPP